MSFLESTRSQFEDLTGRASAGEHGFRASAWSSFERMGLPDRKTESWKYSNLAALTSREWRLAAGGAADLGPISELTARWRDRFDIAVLLDGTFRPELSYLSSAGYQFEPLSFEALSVPTPEDGWTALSMAVATAGFLLRVTGTTAKPLLIVNHVARGWSSGVHQIVIAKGASLVLAELHLGGSETLRSDAIDVRVEEGGKLEWLRVQREDESSRYFSDAVIDLAGDAVLNSVSLQAGALWARAGLRVELSGEGGDAHASGLVFAGGNQHVDQRVQMRHRVARTSSSQLFKSVLKDRARGVLNGKIHIDRQAQQVASSQYNHALLIGSGAEADTKPELEIYADDVKANHGASVGRMDEDKIFYLTSRGIPRVEAQQMLSQAFVGDVLMKLRSPILAAFARQQIGALLPAFLGADL